MTYGPAAQKYLAKGWSTPFPLPVLKKAPPRTDATGNIPEVPVEKIFEFIEECPDHNLGLRMPITDDGYEVIGIDVDHYGEKRGGDTIAGCEMLYGDLPPTYRSSSRDISASPSGIYFYRVPAGRKWAGKVGRDDVEIIQRTFRFACVWPSVWWDDKTPDDGESKTKRTYYWYNAAGQRLKLPPNVNKLPILPEAWQRSIDKGVPSRESAITDHEMSDIKSICAWMAKNLPGYDQLPSSEMESASDFDTLAEEATGGAHDMLISRSHRIVMLATEGHYGCEGALELVKRAFVEEVLGANDDASARRGMSEAHREYNRAIINEIQKLQMDIKNDLMMISNHSGFTAEDEDEFSALPSDFTSFEREVKKAVSKRPQSVDPEAYLNNDTGNAKMLVDYWRGHLLGIKEINNRWLFWREDVSRWEQVPSARLYQTHCNPAVQDRLLVAAEICEDAAKRCSEMADTDGEAKEWAKAIEYRKRATQAGNKAKLDAMLSVALSEPGMAISWDRFDSDRLVLGVENGVLDFNLAPKGKIEQMVDLLVQAKPEDFISLNTHVPFNPNASSSLWDSYLETFLPDEEYRRFVQRVFGYSIIGGNPQRLLVFLQGGTSTGKTTILEAVQKTLGDYVTNVNVGEVFREKQDGGPNPALVSALPKRIITSSEVGQHNYLHADVIKRMTGEDHLAARELYSNEIVGRRPAFTPIIATNSMPTIKDGDSALWRRLLILPFDNQVKQGTEPKVKLTDDKSAMEAVLLWLVHGLLDYLENGLHPSTWPQNTADRAVDFISGTSDLQMFLSQCTRREPEGRANQKDLLSAYTAWCVAENIRPQDQLNRSQLTKALKSNDIPCYKTSVTEKASGRKLNIMRYRGIVLTGKAVE